MSIESKKKKQLIERLNKRLLSEAEMECPKSTKDKELNDNNKKKITETHQYGLPTKDAKEKGQNCGNCVAFDISSRMKDCMGNDSGEVGYCWMHHFMCSGQKWCDTWVKGGPITEDSVSYEKQ
jgi:hypothetical protein